MAKNNRKNSAEQDKMVRGESTKENLAYWASCARSHSNPDVESRRPVKDLSKFKAYASKGD